MTAYDDITPEDIRRIARRKTLAWLLIASGYYDDTHSGHYAKSDTAVKNKPESYANHEAFIDSMMKVINRPLI